jgi:hypothetical protein
MSFNGQFLNDQKRQMVGTINGGEQSGMIEPNDVMPSNGKLKKIT